MFKTLFYGYVYYDFNVLSDPTQEQGFSLVEKSKTSKKRVHYMKFTKGEPSLSSCTSDIMLQDVILSELSTFLTPIVRNSIQRPHDLCSFL